MTQHSIIEHRANYHYIKIEEDYLAICSNGKESPHCKASILSVLEHWMNTKRSKDESDWVYMSMPQWIKQTYMLYERNTITECLRELVAEELVERRPIIMFDQKTFEYRLKVEEVQKRIRALPPKDDYNPNLDGYLVFKERAKAARAKEKKAGQEGVGEKSTTPKRVREKSQGYVKNHGGVGEKSTNPGEKSLGVGEKSTHLNLYVSSSSSSAELKLSPSQAQSDAGFPPPQEKTVEEENQEQRELALRALIRQYRGYDLKKQGAIIDENKCITQLVQNYRDESLFLALAYLVERDFKWSKPDNKHRVHARVLFDEIDRVLLQLEEESAPLPDATPPILLSEDELAQLQGGMLQARPELQLNLFADEVGPYLDVWLGDGELDYYSIRQYEDYEYLLSSGLLDQAIAYGQSLIGQEVREEVYA